MYTKDHIMYLNELQMMSIGNLMRKYKMKAEYAKEILKTIVEDYENVFFSNSLETVIYIQNSKIKVKKTAKVYRGWKDVTKP